MNLKLFYQYYSINENSNIIQEKKTIQDSYNTYVKVYPFEKFESIESETYWKYCKYSLIVYKPFEDNEGHLIDNHEPTPENWIKYWI